MVQLEESTTRSWEWKGLIGLFWSVQTSVEHRNYIAPDLKKFCGSHFSLLRACSGCCKSSTTPPSDSWFSFTDVVIFKGAWNTGSRLGFEDLPTWGGRGEIFYLVAGWPLENSWNHASNLHLSLPVLNNLDNFHCFIRPALMCH